MKKIVIIIAVTTIPLITIIGGLYFFGTMKQQNIIQEAISSIENPYYQNLAKECGDKNESEYKCCLASVYDMIEIEARISTDDKCDNMTINQLKCLGSYKWCVPISNVTSPSTNIDTNIGQYEGKYQLLEEECLNKSFDEGQEECLEAIIMMRENNYEPVPCTEAEYPNGFQIDGLNCIGCENINWCILNEK